MAPPPSQENTNAQNDIWAVELPWGMPKDSHMLPQHSQDLLRAARSGKIYKRPAPLEEEEAEAEIIPEKPEKKDDDLKDKGFTSKAWKQISRQSDASDFEYLAKRRKGLVGVAAPGSAPGPTLIKATVKRTDAGGNEYVQDVVVPQGQHVEGEVLSQTVIPGTNPLSAIPTPPRRKVPTSKKKKKHGPGRGRKKIVVAPTSAPAADGSGGDLSKAASAGAIGPDVSLLRLSSLRNTNDSSRVSRLRMVMLLAHAKTMMWRWAVLLTLHQIMRTETKARMMMRLRMKRAQNHMPLHPRLQGHHHPRQLLYRP